MKTTNETGNEDSNKSGNMDVANNILLHVH